MNETKTFTLEDILSVSTRRLVSSRHMDCLYDLLGWMTQDKLWTHQLLRAWRECEPWLNRWFPKLKEVDTTTLDVLIKKLSKSSAKKEACRLWVLSEAARLALDDTYDIPRIPQDDHERKHPVDELVEMRGRSEGIITVVVDEPTPN